MAKPGSQSQHRTVLWAVVIACCAAGAPMLVGCSETANEDDGPAVRLRDIEAIRDQVVALRVVVQGRDLFEHPSLAHDHSDDVNLGIHAIHTGGPYDSHLLIPVVR